MSSTIYGGDTITDGKRTDVVKATKYSLRGHETEYNIGGRGYDGVEEYWVPESEARLVAYGRHEYVSSTERVCGHCGTRKRDHGDGSREAGA